jgi:hypothetical protein
MSNPTCIKNIIEDEGRDRKRTGRSAMAQSRAHREFLSPGLTYTSRYPRHQEREPRRSPISWRRAACTCRRKIRGAEMAEDCSMRSSNTNCAVPWCTCFPMLPRPITVILPLYSTYLLHHGVG